MTPTLTTYLILCPLVFLAGFVDSAAGGGGIISLPAYLFAGLPPHLAYGTNKFSAACGTTVATLNYFRVGKIRWKLALSAAAAALLGSWVGTRLVLFLPEQALRVALMVVLPFVAVFMLCNRGFGSGRRKKPAPEGGRAVLISTACGLGIGAYDGFFGPGTGTFLLLAFVYFLGLDMITASGNAKVVNLASNLAALMTYLVNGKVLFAIGIPCAVCSVIGGDLGARLAIKGGAKFIRPMVALVVALLMVKLAFDLFT